MSGNNHRKRGVHRNSVKHLRCTTDLSRRSPWGDQIHTNNRAGNVNTSLWSGRTGTNKCSSYQIEIQGNVTVGTYNCDHERHSGATKNTRLWKRQPREARNKVLLMQLKEKFHSWEQYLLGKESGTSRESVPQEKDGRKWKGMWMTIGGHS